MELGTLTLRWRKVPVNRTTTTAGNNILLAYEYWVFVPDIEEEKQHIDKQNQ